MPAAAEPLADTAELWRRFSEPLRLYLLRRLADPQDAEDLLQDIFLKIHTHLDALPPADRLLPWLYQVARNTLVDHYRRRRSSQPLPDDLADPAAANDPDPAERLAAGLGEMIAGLPEKYQQPLQLSELEGLPQAEVAGRLGLSVSGAKSRVQRGRRLLRAALFDCCHFEFDRRGGVLDYYPHRACCQAAGRKPSAVNRLSPGPAG
jgi:RNA polymerase sigma-70 factor (ECF subfamily)